ncbi:MAG: 23S rRNA (adenine(1618)-N(6))-methyltransferase RlmF [Lewinellaceae bacterium]|nr:23S rRNA (adenine(1618)-N(6))-methyltransferase RlmF [Lewinellaceae bacterium]
MLPIKIEHPKEKSNLHPRNQHRARYDFNRLTEVCPELSPYVRPNLHGDESIDFADPAAVKMLNFALLRQYYGIGYWDIPENYLCPPIPGRADYIHYMADLLGNNNYGKIPTGSKVRCLDVGVGANCVYPIIGNASYGWSFIGSDIDPVSLASANKIIDSNPALQQVVECRLQANPKNTFAGILQKGEIIDLSVCNPPFHASPEEARAGTLRKLNHLNGEKVSTPILNFGGQELELCCEGGEEKFVLDMISQSRQFATSCFWFSTLISKKSNVKIACKGLEKVRASDVKTISMGQGHKNSRILAWTFLSREQQKLWRNTRWNSPVPPRD